jgi:hypothetical protein
VIGEAGVGKTSLVAALTHGVAPDGVWWHRIRPGVNDSLEALLLELAHVLAREGAPELRDRLHEAPRDLGAASRLALEGLAGRRRLLVLDGFGSASDPEPVESFLEEAVARLPEVSVVTIGRAVPHAAIVEVPPLTRAETAQLFRSRGLTPASHVLDAVYELSGGNIGMLAAVAAWWSGRAEGLEALERDLQRRSAVDTLRRLTGFAHRSAA